MGRLRLKNTHQQFTFILSPLSLEHPSSLVMDTFDSFGCDPVYMNASAPESVNVDNYCYLHQATPGDIQQQEEQEIWLCSVMNEEMDLTRSSLSYHDDFSYHAMCNEAPTAVQHASLSEIQLYAEVCNAANVNA
jgi:hypothetical protein